jgi:hypothetical protein
MKYLYDLKEDRITEYFILNKSKIQVASWHINVIKNNSLENNFSKNDLKSQLKYIAESLQRTKKWTIEKHPELLI